jgi:maleylacetoacetate isomerase
MRGGHARTTVKLYGYFRSSAAYRVRIALNLKGVPHEHAFVHLLRDGGGQKAPDYLARNPQGLVPALELDGGQTLIQSLAIIEYLDEVHPEPPLMPGDAVARAQVRAIAQAVACDIHPLNNLRVLKYLRHDMNQPKEAVDAWYRQWIESGFAAIETMIGEDGFCIGGQATLSGDNHQRKEPMSMCKRMIMCAAAVALTVTAASAQDAATATAGMQNLEGQPVGQVQLRETPHGLIVTGEFTALPEGVLGFHIHAVGACEPPFQSAGGHFNPDGHQHGMENPQGMHAGDLP